MPATGSALLEEGVSDSASLDNAVEIALRQGTSLSAAMLRLTPPAWESDAGMEPGMCRFLDSAASTQEPWDGPAALAFTDGKLVGAKLDRNGLRPLRYIIKAGGFVIAGSETGLADIEEKQVVERKRLGPGEMLLVDPARGQIWRNGELSRTLVSPCEQRRARGTIVSIARTTSEVETPRWRRPSEPQGWKRTAAAYGWSDDQYRLLFLPMGFDGKEAVWSMGDDAPPAFLSGARRPLWDYCKQRFAQVTNPPIDPLRESHVMSLEVRPGGRAILPSPVADAMQTGRLRAQLSPSGRPLAAACRKRHPLLLNSRANPAPIAAPPPGTPDKRHLAH
jgi:Glutamine amidotransferases class-II/Glutamate synthase central domain